MTTPPTTRQATIQKGLEETEGKMTMVEKMLLEASTKEIMMMSQGVATEAATEIATEMRVEAAAGVVNKQVPHAASLATTKSIPTLAEECKHGRK